MKIKLYSARELDKKFPSGKWNGITLIEHRSSDKYWWYYYGIPRNCYKKLARAYLKVIDVDDTPPFIVYMVQGEIAIPELFVKKVKQ